MIFTLYNNVFNSRLSAENNMYNKIDNTSDDENNQFSTIKRSPKDNIKNSPASTPVENTSCQENKSNVLENVEQITDQQFVDEYIYGLSNPLFQARALYDYQAGKYTFYIFPFKIYCFLLTAKDNFSIHYSTII